MTKYDVAVLTVTSTELDPGAVSQATATLLLEGADVGLETTSGGQGATAEAVGGLTLFYSDVATAYVPIASDDTGTVDEAGSVLIDLAANDWDGDDGLNLASIQVISAPANGNVVVNANGTVTYTHNGSETTADSFTYRIDDAGGTHSNVATVTLTVTPTNDPPTGVPVVTGTTTEDQTLTADTSGIADADGLGSFSYQWYLDGGAIGGATASTFVLGDTDVGKTITVQVSYQDGQGFNESLTSVGVGPIAAVNDTPTGLPVITGTATEDQTLTADTSGIADVDGLGAFSYQWYRDGGAIGGATASTFVLGDTDVGKTITVQVSYQDGQGFNESLTSVGVGPIAAVNDTPTGLPVITGTTTEDQTPTADTSGIADAGVPAPGYQWYRDGGAIGGATASTFVLRVRCRNDDQLQVSYQDGRASTNRRPVRRCWSDCCR
ncbi:MAG: cadherin-like domain-containing protein [Gammaproteobacteria bacterium]|nr:cadherin-like domain-containing protein [Gammaproteobacteria bacterium]